MINFSQYLKEELLTEKDNLHGKIGADGKALGHVRDYILPLLPAAGRAKTANALKNVGGVKADTSINGPSYKEDSESTHVLQLPYGDHPAGTAIKVTHVSAGGEDGRSLYAHTTSHGKIPLSKIAKPAALKKKPKTQAGFDAEAQLAKNLGTRAAGSSATGFDFHYTGGSAKEKPAVRGKVRFVESDAKAVKGVVRPDVRGESKLLKGKFGQSVVSYEKGSCWGFRNKSKMNPMFAKARVVGSDGKERSLIDHLNKHHSDGMIERGFTVRAASGTARHYLESNDVNTLHIHHVEKDKKTGKVTVNRGTTYTVGKTSLRGKTGLSHLGDDNLMRLDGAINILATKTGRAEVTHRPSQSVMRELAGNAHGDNKDNHRDLSNSDHAAEFKIAVDKHIKEFEKKKTKLKEDLDVIEEAKSTQEKIMAAAERAAAVFGTSQKSKQRDKARFVADAEARQESEQRKLKTANREAMSARKEVRAQQSDTDLRWADYENKVMRGVTGRGAVSQFAKGANLEAPNQFKLEEEAPANAMGTAGISGLDTAVDVGIAGRDMLLTPEILRRPPPKMFGGKRVFTVPSKDYYKATLGRRKGQHWRSMVNGPLGEEIRQYALENKEAPIIVEDETTGAMMYLRYGKR